MSIVHTGRCGPIVSMGVLIVQTPFLDEQSRLVHANRTERPGGTDISTNIS